MARAASGSPSPAGCPSWRKKTASAEKGAARMVDRDEGRIGDDVERLLAAIVRDARASRCRRAGRRHGASGFSSAVSSSRRHDEAVGPVRSAPRRARGERERSMLSSLRRRDQRVGGALLRRRASIEQPFAHAERRDHDLARPRDARDDAPRARAPHRRAAAGGPRMTTSISRQHLAASTRCTRREKLQRLLGAGMT